MRPDVVAKHLARVRVTCEKNNNLDYSGLSVRGMTLGGREKCIVTNKALANTKDLLFRGSIDHVTLVSVVSATGQAYTPLVVLPGKEARCRRRNGNVEALQDFLPRPCYAFMREKAGVDSAFFSKRAELFVKETQLLREKRFLTHCADMKRPRKRREDTKKLPPQREGSVPNVKRNKTLKENEYVLAASNLRFNIKKKRHSKSSSRERCSQAGAEGRVNTNQKRAAATSSCFSSKNGQGFTRQLMTLSIL